MAPNECWEHEYVDIFGVSIQQGIDADSQIQLGSGAIVWDTALLTGEFFAGIGARASSVNFFRGNAKVYYSTFRSFI